MNNGLKEQLHDISIRTMIGQLPKIINDNNTKICDYIDKIYDPSSECITKNIDNVSDNKSYVKSNLGQFKKLIVEEFNAKNINHDALNGRYLYNDNSTGLEIIPIPSLLIRVYYLLLHYS